LQERSRSLEVDCCVYTRSLESRTRLLHKRPFQCQDRCSHALPLSDVGSDSRRARLVRRLLQAAVPFSYCQLERILKTRSFSTVNMTGFHLRAFLSHQYDSAAACNGERTEAPPSSLPKCGCKRVRSPTLMAEKNEAHPTETANLQGARQALASEVIPSDYWDEARINEITGYGIFSEHHKEDRPSRKSSSYPEPSRPHAQIDRVILRGAASTDKARLAQQVRETLSRLE